MAALNTHLGSHIIQGAKATVPKDGDAPATARYGGHCPGTRHWVTPRPSPGAADGAEATPNDTAASSGRESSPQFGFIYINIPQFSEVARFLCEFDPRPHEFPVVSQTVVHLAASRSTTRTTIPESPNRPPPLT